jgi:hypothetical protein
MPLLLLIPPDYRKSLGIVVRADGSLCLGFLLEHTTSKDSHILAATADCLSWAEFFESCQLRNMDGLWHIFVKTETALIFDSYPIDPFHAH